MHRHQDCRQDHARDKGAGGILHFISPIYHKGSARWSDPTFIFSSDRKLRPNRQGEDCLLSLYPPQVCQSDRIVFECLQQTLGLAPLPVAVKIQGDLKRLQPGHLFLREILFAAQQLIDTHRLFFSHHAYDIDLPGYKACPQADRMCSRLPRSRCRTVYKLLPTAPPN